MVEIAKLENNQILQNWTEDQITLIKQMVAKGSSDDELKMFLYIAKKTNLDPFLKEIWFYKIRPTDAPVIMTSRDGYLKIAHSHPAFDGMESYTIDDDKGNPIKAVCVVYRKDKSFPFKAEAKLKEYKKNTTIWSQYPSAMIQKVAEVMALKRAFSISGIVTQEELGLEEPIISEPEIKPLPTKKDFDIQEYNLQLKNENTKEISEYLTANYRLLDAIQRQSLQNRIKELRNNPPAQEKKVIIAEPPIEEIDVELVHSNYKDDCPF